MQQTYASRTIPPSGAEVFGFFVVDQMVMVMVFVVYFLGCLVSGLTL